MPSSRPIKTALLFSLSTVVASLGVACGGRVESIPLPGEGGGSSTGTATGRAPGEGGSATGGSSSTGPTCKGSPSCDPSDTPIATSNECVADGVCYARTRCGKTIWCTSPGDLECDAIPVCPAGTVEVPTCPPDGGCFTVSRCGETIECATTCEGPQPICDPGDKEVPGPSQCLQDDAVCYSRSTCGYTIWCTGPAK